jgi:YesN/AraC family two-component response regulator
MPDKKLEELNRLLIAILLSVTAESDSSRRADLLETYQSNIIDILLRHFSIIGYCNNGVSISSDATKTLIRIINYIIEHHREKISLGDLSVMLHFNKNYVSQFLIKHLPGYTEWLNFIRAGMSARLLIETEMNIDAVSGEMGFSDKKYYYNAFKKWFACTPSAYRREYKNLSKQKDDYKTLSFAEITPIVQSLANRIFLDLLIEQDAFQSQAQ